MKEKNNLKLNLYTVCLIILLMIIIMGGFIYKLYKDKQLVNSNLTDLDNEIIGKENIVDKSKETIYQNDIIKYELKTHEYFNNAPDVDKYFIDSEVELSKFYSIYSEKLDINKDYLKNNSIFIRVQQVGSGSIQMKLSSVTFNNNTVEFIIDRNSPEIGTTDMAFWYFVAIIPNNKLNNLNFSDWRKPSEILSNMENKSSDINNYTFKLDSANKYVITTDYQWTTMQNDGGSNTSIYYQIDLDNNVIIKVKEGYKANLSGTNTTKKDIIYTKKISDQDFIESIKSLLKEVISKEDINETNNYKFFTLLSLNYEKKLYNENTINDINSLLKKIDEFNT